MKAKFSNLYSKMAPLNPGDQVALACPGSICTSSQHPALAKEYLENQYQLMAHFKADTLQGTSPKQRVRYFLDYLLNDDIRMITALRGGEGCADIIPYLHQHYNKIKSLSPKWLLGFSDFTAILIYFSQVYQWPIIHGSSVLQFALQKVDKMSEQITMQLLCGKLKGGYGLMELKPLNAAARRNQSIKAELTGGCLSLINICIKDIWEIETKNKIIFFEDCGEKAHKIIRTLKYFSRLKLFDQAKAVIFGDFTCYPIGNNADEQVINERAILKTLNSFAEHHDLPVLYTKQFGHGQTNLPLLFQTDYRLNLGERPELNLI